jgi:DNA repair protein RecN (Recombination protein N)
MLKQLRIRNLALIQDAEIDFNPGFCVVTGETGAGKSVFLTSLKLCAGERATSQMIRNGEEKASVEGVFDVTGRISVLAKLESMGIDPDDGEITIQREILVNGKSRARINGSIVSLTDLSELGDELIQLHGQSEQVMLRDIRTHMELLDSFGGHEQGLEAYRDAWREWQKCVHQEADLRRRASDLAQQKEFLQFQSEELDKAHLQAGEDVILEERLAQASGLASRRKLVEQSLDLLDGDTGILDQLVSLEKSLANLAQGHKALTELLEQAHEADIIYREITRELRAIGKSQPLSPAEMERDNSRIAQLQRLQRKYRTDLSGLIELRDKRRQELTTLDNLDDELILLEKSGKDWRKKMIGAGEALSMQRKSSAVRMDIEVQNRIRELGMGKATFFTQIEASEPGPLGIDRVEFLMAPNAGEGQKPLRQAVSGGELSRVLLAFKSVLATRDHIAVLVFDEVDSGISGEIAHRIGQCLQDLGKSHQVLTITHLHQVASRAHNQLHVAKHEIEGRTYTEITTLDHSARVREIARMLGDPKSDAVLSHARELLEEHHA